MKVNINKIDYMIVISIISAVLLVLLYIFTYNVGGLIVTESREELKSITLQLCDEKGNVIKPIIISDSEYMDQIYDHLLSIKTRVNQDDIGSEGDFRLVLTYAYAYDNQSGKQDVVFLGANTTFYRHDNNGYVCGKSGKLYAYITNLLENAELGMVSENDNELNSITVFEYEGTNVKSSISIVDIETINRIYSYLESIDTKVVLYPGEMSEWALDKKYELILKYDNQDEVIIFTGTEMEDIFYRYSGTVTSKGKEGYVYGKNAALHEFIAALLENQQCTASVNDEANIVGNE